jgi:hypothetical protein
LWRELCIDKEEQYLFSTMESKQTNSEEKQIDKTKGSLKRKAAEMREMAEKLGLQVLL